ncbi:hypothetical protein DAPPUDRAFT_99985 [Daphnia pulex]|uniref:Cuticle protein n=1 Tax=Daphnia pulex TaxID=6669 RepID=E9G8Y6_DAPPU|nr:hypothetical protein DAPPUDRAFT_99985 [Daphnia pulex]|eukprot:EFX84192.1 hypothetical protein DAPPUDRAFT_99985 [Daphnia pulex]
MKLPIFFVLLAVVSAENYASSYKTTEDAKKPGYSFESSYDNNSRSESRHGKVTTGSYRVPLPDGRVQVVNYRADENGYVADVKYEGEAKYPEYKPASSYSAPAYKAEAVPVYEVVTKPTYKIPTTPAPTTTSPTYKAPAYHVEPSYIAPAPTAAPTYEDRSYPDPEYKALYKIATTTPAPTTTSRAYVAPVDVEYKVPPYSTPAYQTPVSPAYGIRYIGDAKQFEDRNKYLETKVNPSPAYKSTFFVIPKYKVSSLAAPIYETPEVPDYKTSFYSAPAAPLPLAYRPRYAVKAAANKVVDHSTDYKESPYVAPKVTVSVYTPVYSARTTTTPAYQDLTTTAPAYNVPITTAAAPVYTTSSYKAPKYETSTSAPAYKPSTFFNSNKDSISTGFKELSRIFRETSLTAGNKNWDNFFNKAWEFARTKY